jgi:hypothetical protein
MYVMSTNTPSANTQAKPERVYVKIPKAGPGQGYRAPKNFAKPGLAALGKLIVILACLSLPIVPALIIGMIVASTYATEPYLLWMWATMTVLVVGFGIFVAWGLAREAIGVQHASDYQMPLRGLPRAG